MHIAQYSLIILAVVLFLAGARHYSMLHFFGIQQILQKRSGVSLTGSTAPVVLEGALRPDLRHWEQVPAAFVVTRASEPNLEPCLAKQRDDVQRIL